MTPQKLLNYSALFLFQLLPVFQRPSPVKKKNECGGSCFMLLLVPRPFSLSLLIETYLAVSPFQFFSLSLSFAQVFHDESGLNKPQRH